MKVELKTMRIIFIVTVFTVFIYLIYLNLKLDRYEPIKEESKIVEVDTSLKDKESEEIVETVEEVVEAEEPIVYDGKTLDELANQLNKSLNSTISGKGYLIASYSLERGVDPYIATAIILVETGCKWSCSSLVYECNNVGGQVGSGCGNYNYFSSLDEGIMAFIDNLYNNYISYGLTTPEAMNSKYATSPVWAENVNNYIESIKTQ